LINCIPELKDIELELNEMELIIGYCCDAMDMFTPLPLGVLLCKQCYLVAKKSWTMKLPVKHYPATKQWMKLMNGKSIRLVLLSCLKRMLAGDCFKKALKLT